MGQAGGDVALVVTVEQWWEVEEQLRRKDLVPRVRERLEMVKAASLGHDLDSIATWSGRGARTIRYWLGRYETEGVAGLADAPRSGRPVLADVAYTAALEAAVDTSPRALGLEFDVWTSASLSAYLAQTTGVRIAPGWVRALLSEWGYACGRPKHTLSHLRDPNEVTACELELAQVGGKGSVGG